MPDRLMNRPREVGRAQEFLMEVGGSRVAVDRGRVSAEGGFEFWGASFEDASIGLRPWEW